MDILTHALSGTAVATCAATYVGATPLRKAKIILIGTVGGAFPDIDAISMWSRFDSIFGRLFDLSHTGKVIYGSKFWYSHHAFFHSIIASILFGILLVSSIFLFQKVFSKKQIVLPSLCKSHLVYLAVFILAAWAHLAGDLPTPSSVWGGIALFWPSVDYVGGSGKIWWWNNYDIFLLIVGSIIINLTIPAIFKKVREKSRLFTTTILSITLALILIQVNTRQFDYAYEGNTSKYAEMELNSKKEQQRILGKHLYRYMEHFDGMLKFYF